MSALGFEIPVFHGCIVSRGATSADLKVSADNYGFAYNPVCVCAEGVKTPEKVNGHTLKHGHAFGKLSGWNSLEKSSQEGASEV